MKAAPVVLFAVVCVAVAAALPRPEENKDGGWKVGADQTRGGGTVVRAEGQKTWDVSKDGKVQAEVHGHWERTYGGPNRGNRDHGAGASIGGSWGK